MTKRRNRPDSNSDKFAAICASKRPFETEQQALEAADFGMLEHMTLNLGVYQCNVCNHWHLTNIKQGV